jgi:hypothetical protein
VDERTFLARKRALLKDPIAGSNPGTRLLGEIAFMDQEDMKQLNDVIDKLTMQIGVLMAVSGAIVKELGDRPQFRADVRGVMEHVMDAMLAKNVSDESLELARGTVDSILGVLPAE